MLVEQRLQAGLHLTQRRFLLGPFLFPFFVGQGAGTAYLNTHGHFFVRAHVALQGETGIGLLEKIPGRAGCGAEVALGVLFSVDLEGLPAGTLGRSILTGPQRNIYVIDQVLDHPDPGTRRIEAAVFRAGVKPGASHLARAATDAFVKIDFYLSNYLLV